MNGIDYLLDTNFILGLLKSSDETLEQISKRRIESQKCAYSAVSRMELLAFPGITPSEEALIQENWLISPTCPLPRKLKTLPFSCAGTTKSSCLMPSLQQARCLPEQN